MSEKIKQQSEQAEKVEKPIEDPNQQMIKLGRGTLKLKTPIRSRSEDVNEVRYDFTKLSGWDYAAAMDSDPEGNALFSITGKQAMMLFSMAAAKETDGLDATDIRQRMGIEDGIKAVQLAKLFFVAAARAGNSRITNE